MIERTRSGAEMAAPRANAAGVAPHGPPANPDRQQEILAAIESLRVAIHAMGRQGSPHPQAPVDLDAFKSQIVEAEKLKADLREMRAAIEQTKKEIAQLRRSDRDEDKISSAGDALRAVVQDTEQATDGIINAVEQIEEVCSRAIAQAGGDGLGLGDALNEQVTAIFEFCNFQDITGQRITKVVDTMEFIDERIARMMEIWGGQDAFAGIEGEITEDRPEGEILDGPALPGKRVSQDDIDALFD